MDEYIKDGQLTEAGRQIASALFTSQCDRRPCFMCGSRNSETHGPGGHGCPVAGLSIGGGDVENLLTLYMGRKPGMEALDALMKK